MFSKFLFPVAKNVLQQLHINDRNCTAHGFVLFLFTTVLFLTMHGDSVDQLFLLYINIHLAPALFQPYQSSESMYFSNLDQEKDSTKRSAFDGFINIRIIKRKNRAKFSFMHCRHFKIFYSAC